MYTHGQATAVQRYSSGADATCALGTVVIKRSWKWSFLGRMHFSLTLADNSYFQHMMGPSTSGAVRSWPSPKARGTDPERQAATAQERRPEGLPQARGQGRRPEKPPHSGGQVPRRTGATHLQGAAAARAQEGQRSCSTFKVRRGSSEKIPLIQGKEQLPRFAGAALKGYPTSEVREAQVRR